MRPLSERLVICLGGKMTFLKVSLRVCIDWRGLPGRRSVPLRWGFVEVLAYVILILGVAREGRVVPRCNH